MSPDLPLQPPPRLYRGASGNRITLTETILNSAGSQAANNGAAIEYVLKDETWTGLGVGGYGFLTFLALVSAVLLFLLESWTVFLVSGALAVGYVLNKTLLTDRTSELHLLSMHQVKIIANAKKENGVYVQCNKPRVPIYFVGRAFTGFRKKSYSRTVSYEIFALMLLLF